MGNASSLQPEEHLQIALGKRTLDQLRGEGHALVWDTEIQNLGAELGMAAHLADHTVERLLGDALLSERNGGVFEASALAAWYEENFERRQWRDGNRLRREILRAAAAAKADGTRWIEYRGESRRFTDRPYEETATACRFLQEYGLVEMDEAMGKSFHLEITANGFDLVRDEVQLARALPVTATEDEQAHGAVASDVLDEVISSCEQLLEERGWSSARQELRRGDTQHAEGHWSDAVSEYYAAIESGLKYRLDEEGATYKPGAALKDLAKVASVNAIIPANYQALFGFLDSVRSPRKHGRGPAVDEVEVGPAESLLMANHARSLLVYLGHRPG